MPTYEEVVADPSSAAFLELAKSLIDNGEYLRAIEVCRDELPAQSIAACVLWGKALICLGRPADAMEQFDRAIQLGRDNPRTYAMISHALVQRGLYRSALPLLQRAAALAPDSSSLGQWLSQTQRALEGGPAPVLDEKELDALFGRPAPEEEPAPGGATAAAAPSTALPEPAVSLREPGGLAAVEPLTGPGESALEAPQPRADREALGEGFVPIDGQPALPSPAEGSPGLLEDVVEAPEVVVTAEVPKQAVSAHDAERIAEQYERELRQELAQKSEQSKRHFVSRHAGKIAAVAILAIALIAGMGIFLAVRHANQGRDLKDDLAEARRAIAQDTPKSYALALDRLAHALKMDDEAQEAWALTAYARSIVYAEHGRASGDRQASRAALAHAGVRDRFVPLALAADFYLADPSEKDELAKRILESTVDAPELYELAGRILLARKDSKAAVERFRRALTLSSGNVRAMVALADYYRDSGDHPGALKFYATAGQLSPAHPAVVLGQAESRLELGVDLDEALRQINELPRDELLSPDQLARRELAVGRLQLARGNYEEAINKLSEGARAFRPQAFDFQLALGDARRAAGKFDAAQAAYDAAIELRPQSELAKEGLGRALLARDRERELLSRFPSQSEARRIALVRAIALAKLGDWKRARLELSKTQIAGKYPSEAAVYLALADAAEGAADRAQAVLEKLLASSRKAKGDIRVALGTVYWQRGALDKARSQFEEAAKEPDDYEGSCSLGRLLQSLGSVEAALEPLAKAVQRNAFHGEARRALAQAQLSLGRSAEAIAQLQAWRTDQPTSAAANKGLAFSLLRAGRLKEAEVALAKALSLDPLDGESHRIRAQILFAKGDGRGAFPEAERATKLKPADGDNWCELGRALSRQCRSDAAAKAYEEGLRRNAESFCARVGLHEVRLPSVSPTAAKELTELARRAPDFWNRSFALATLSRVLQAAGSAKEARKMADQAVSADPFSGAAHFALGQAALRQKDEALAIEELGKALELDPTDAFIHLSLADALMRRAPSARALEHYQWYLRLAVNGPDQARVKRALTQLKKRLALR